jgi:hypothetical protein
VQPVQVLLGGHGLPRVIGPASTNFDDYLDTVAADDARPSCMNQAFMSLQILIGTASPSLAVDLRVEGRTTATVYAIDGVESIQPHHPARSRHGAEVKAIPVVPLTSRKRALKSSSGRPSAGSRFDW